MARSGSFGGSLNPFGSGSLGGFSQYDIGSNLAELEVYKVEVAWGNGTATDDEYLAALTKAVNATDPNTKERETAQNRLDDAVYRIGRSVAETKGLDELIAFDQSSLAKMNQANLRYRSVKDSLDAEMAQRRSRDYGDLVRRYNAGEISTQKLVDWVATTMKTVDPADPDFQNWKDTAADLGRRLQTEKDSKVYQDYQQGRMKAPDFLAYVQGRRDGYDPSSPDYAEWNRKLEDANKSVKDAEQQKADTLFFNAYDEGKKSDQQYLAYLRDRIGGMEPDNPDLPSWKHRMAQAAFSLAEDQLRFDVQRGKAPVSRLVTFYENYQRTLNPGSQEYRQIARNLMSLNSSGGSSGGGSSSGGRSRSGTGSLSGLGANGSPKAINPKYTLDNIVPLLSVNVNGDKKLTAAATKALDLNLARIQDARQRGDAVWLFQDPRKPGQMVAARDPQGNPILDAKGKPVMVAGSGYLPVSDGAYANLLGVKTQLHFDLAGKALANHDAAGYYYQLKLAQSGQDSIRLVNSQAVDAANKKWMQAVQDGIDLAMKTGDFATALNLASTMQRSLEDDLKNPMLDETRRSRLEAMQEKLAQNPLLPQVLTDPSTGKIIQRVGGAIDIGNSSFDAQGNATSVALLPGWHFSLDKTDPAGRADWGIVRDDRQDGTWEQSHVFVHTTYGGKVVTGEVKVTSAPLNPQIIARTPDGYVRTDAGGAAYISYTDEHGNQVRAYSIDNGATWVRPMTGTAPVLELNIDLKTVSDATGQHWVDANTNEVVFTKNPDGSVTKNGDYFVAHPGSVDFYGMGNLRKRQAELGRVQTTNADGSMRQGQFVSGYEEQYLYGAGRSGLKTGGIGLGAGNGGVEVGAPGQAMQVVTASPSGAINFTSMGEDQRPDNGLRGATGRPGGQDSFAYGTNQNKPAARARLGPPTPANMAVKGPRVSSQTGFNLSVSDSRVNSYTGFAMPSIKSQLPADTPDGFAGVGFRTPQGGQIPSLKAVGPQPSLGAPASKGSVPPAIKKSVPLPVKKPTPTVSIPKATATAKAAIVTKTGAQTTRATTTKRIAS